MKQLDLFDSLAKDDKAKKEKLAAYNKAYYEANKEKISAHNKAYYEANKEKRSASNKAYQEANKEKILAYKEANKEKILAYKKVYYAANKEKLGAINKAYKEANKEKISAYNKAYKEANKEKLAPNKSSCEAKRRALKLKQLPIHLRDCPQEKQRLIQIYKLRNILSKATGVQHHVDHMWPLSDGGPHWSGNLQVITAYENLSKSASVCEATKSTIIKSLESFQSERTI